MKKQQTVIFTIGVLIIGLLGLTLLVNSLFHKVDNGVELDVSFLSAELETQHILNCQDPQTGAINDVWGAPTWVVPGEMAVATMALQIMGYKTQALQACDYLATIQASDGGWHNQYNNYTVVDAAKYTRHTAQVLMAFYHCNYNNSDAMQAGINFLLDCIQDSDGLVCGGKSASNEYYPEKWLSDNVYAAKVFEYFNYTNHMEKIVATIDTEFYIPNKGYWYQTKDTHGMREGKFGWINFAPPNWGLNCTYPKPDDLASVIQNELQTPDGAILEHEDSTKKMPGIGLQAHMALRETGGGTKILAEFYEWLKTSGLVQGNNTDPNGDVGGIIDWIGKETGTTANWWERFIDTSAFVVFNEKDFKF